jgi:APA family basic amino acid/polyamine antiporter
VAREPVRPLGFTAATSLVVGGVIGIGIFLVPAELARSLAAPGWVFAMWAVTGLMAVCGALCYGELAARFPEAGGPYVYLRVAYGERVAFLYGWECLLVMDPGLTAALGMGAAEQAAHLVPLGPVGQKLLAASAIVAVAALTALGTRLAAGFLVTLTALKVAALVLIVGWGFGSGAAGVDRLDPWFARPPGAEPLLAGLAGGFVATFFSFGGWWEAAKMAGEVRRPARTLPLAFATGIVVVTLLYVLASAVFLAALAPGEAVATAVSAPEIADRLFGATGGRLLAAIVLLSALGSLAAVMLASPRLYVALASDRLFPRVLGAPSTLTGTPLGAIAVQAALACALLAVGRFADIVAYFVFSTMAFITASVAAILVLPPPPPGCFRAPARRCMAGIFIGLAAVLLALVAGGRLIPAASGVAVVALGLPVHAWLRRRSSSRAGAAGGQPESVSGRGPEISFE